DGWVDGVPVVTGVRLAGEIIREDTAWKEHCHTCALTIVPVTYMLDTSAEFDAQLSVHLPGIVNIESRVLVSHIANRSRIAFRVARDVADDKVRVRVVRRT